MATSRSTSGALEGERRIRREAATLARDVPVEVVETRDVGEAVVVDAGGEVVDHHAPPRTRRSGSFGVAGAMMPKALWASLARSAAFSATVPAMASAAGASAGTSRRAREEVTKTVSGGELAGRGWTVVLGAEGDHRGVSRGYVDARGVEKRARS